MICGQTCSQWGGTAFPPSHVVLMMETLSKQGEDFPPRGALTSLPGADKQRDFQSCHTHNTITMSQCLKWWFPRMVVLPNHPFQIRIFSYKPSILGVPPWLWKPPNKKTQELICVHQQSGKIYTPSTLASWESPRFLTKNGGFNGRIIYNWLVVWLPCFIFPEILGMSSSQLTFLFFRGVAQPPTR